MWDMKNIPHVFAFSDWLKVVSLSRGDKPQVLGGEKPQE